MSVATSSTSGWRAVAQALERAATFIRYADQSVLRRPADGRLLLVKSPSGNVRDECFPTKVKVILNWYKELKRLAPKEQS